MSPPSSIQLPLYQTFIASLPLDTAKVTLQLQPKSANPKYRGLIGTTLTLAKEQGPAALYKGLGPGLHRQILFGGLRIGMYEPVKGLFVGKDHTGDISLGTKIAAGLTTGALGIAVASPTDLVKVRMQSEGKLAPGQARRYPSAFAAYGIIARQEGVRALWTGLGPNMARNAIINAAELASYDQIKQTLLRSGVFNDDIYCHIASGLGAGFFAVCVGSPVDVVKSRMMGAAPGVYSGVIDTFIKTARKDGVLAFYSGFGPNFARLGTWNVIMFLTLEKVKGMMAAASAH
ncbi:Matrilysin [Prototheca wickerhamii]|uniref:Matrilysin n=1 Tax=Prototheca wickerhamii TaxID=3111 RepID=A0AAD9MM54_PROWI|nr:Matrilysin [Prototheca wickerhamii]